MAKITRGFLETADGEVHFRETGTQHATLPIVVLHPGPTASHSVVPLLERLGEHRHVIAPDLMGMGDSDGPAVDNPRMDYYAEMVFRFLDARGGFPKFDLWGSMTGAHCGIEMSLRKPERVNRLYIEMVQFYGPEMKKMMQGGHAPKAKIDHYGSQVYQMWNLARDQHAFFPWFTPEAQYRRGGSLPTPDQLHEKVVELLKACRTYHHGLGAALHYPTAEKLAQVKVPVFGPETFKEHLPGATVRGDFCVGPSTAPGPVVDKAAKEILRHLAI